MKFNTFLAGILFGVGGTYFIMALSMNKYQWWFIPLGCLWLFGVMLNLYLDGNFVKEDNQVQGEKE